MVAIGMRMIIWILGIVVLCCGPFYDDSKRRPFGIRFWLALLSTLWMIGSWLVSLFVTYTFFAVMVYNQYERPLVYLSLVGVFVSIFLSVCCYLFTTRMLALFWSCRRRYYRRKRR